MDQYNGNHFYGMHLIWWVIWIIFILWILASTLKSSRKKRKEETPLDILNKRFANGEISKEEYDEKKKIINKIK